jgi:hypothetical protein
VLATMVCCLCNSGLVRYVCVLTTAACCGSAVDDESVVDGDAPPMKRFGCRFCEYRSAEASNVTRHERSHTGEKPFGCRFCEYRSAEASKITVHERQRRARPACSPLGYNKNDVHYAPMNDDHSDSAQHHRNRRRVVWNFIAQQ